MTKILIASPTYDGSVRKEYMHSIFCLTDFFRQAGIAWDILLESATVLHVMRSVMASKALLDEEFTHLLFVDTDMGFNVSAVRKLIEARKDVIGCAYPYRTIPLHEEIARAGETFRKSIGAILPYAVRFAPDTRAVRIEKGICEVQGIGTGLLLIAKEALGTMVEKGCVAKFVTGFPYSQWYRHPEYFGFFDHVKIDGAYLGEDYSFCQRWVTGCGGKVHAVVDEEIMHVGSLPVLGRYEDRLKSGRL